MRPLGATAQDTMKSAHALENSLRATHMRWLSFHKHDSVSCVRQLQHVDRWDGSCVCGQNLYRWSCFCVLGRALFMIQSFWISMVAQLGTFFVFSVQCEIRTASFASYRYSAGCLAAKSRLIEQKQQALDAQTW